MANIVIVSCEEIRNKNLCPGDAKCFVSAQRKEGKFKAYDEANIVGIVDCGGCDGNRVICELVILKMQLGALNVKVDKVHIGTCIMKFCPYKDKIISALKEKSGVEVVEGTHEYGITYLFK